MLYEGDTCFSTNYSTAVIMLYSGIKTWKIVNHNCFVLFSSL